jgi:leucine dehydrogenase
MLVMNPNTIVTTVTIHGFEKVIRFENKPLKLVGFIAIHKTTLGPALGGTRLWNYPSEAKALEDVLRLAQGMTFKAAGTALPLGGGKAVLIGDAKTIKSPEYFHAYGEVIESLNGMYISAEDINITTEDVRYIAETTSHVVGRFGKSGNPSPFTALGVFNGILAPIQWLKLKTIQHLSFAIQGVGETGVRLMKLLFDAGAKKIYYSEINQDHIDYVTLHFPLATYLAPEDFMSADVDVLVPCALGGVINEHTVDQIKAKLIAGTANNVFQDAEVHGPMLQKRGVLVAPDFMINAGGLINVFNELKQSYQKETVLNTIATIGERLTKVYQQAKDNGTYPQFEAVRFAQLALQ